jgi:hypothetical protein
MLQGWVGSRPWGLMERSEGQCEFDPAPRSDRAGHARATDGRQYQEGNDAFRQHRIA